MNEIQKELWALSDPAYRAFHLKLIPGVNEERVIGVRTPRLRKMAASLSGTPAGEAFLKELPHTYYEENNLHAFLLERRKNFPDLLEEIDRFLPFVDNWATCDAFTPKVFARHRAALLPTLYRWIDSKETYRVRFAVRMLMLLYSGDFFRSEAAEKVAAIRSDEYYVNMMCAWYFATLLAKNEAEILPYFTEQKLCPQVLKKSVQKARESFRVSPEIKKMLKRTL